MNRDLAHTSPLPTEPYPKRDAAGPESFRQTEAGPQTIPLEHDARSLAVTEPVSLPAKPVQPPTDSHTDHLQQLEKFSALLDEELRKSDPAARTKSTPPEPAANADEESLQTYLDRFMERVTGKKAEAPEPTQPLPVTRPIAQPASATSATTPVAMPDAKPGPTQPREPSRAPECRERMAAMRDLANENARSAMNIHAGRHQWRRTKAALILATAATTISSALAVWNLATAAPGTAESAACIGLIAAYLACRFYWRSRSLAALI